jgi:indole-3-pyruvate monooxygenase
MAGANHTDTIIIGASAAGLACAVCLKQYQIPFILLEQSDKVGIEWTNRYDRLHLHTPKKHSELPHFRMPVNFDRYVAKDDFVTYLQQYSNVFNIQPVFNKKVIHVRRTENLWEVFTTGEKFVSNNVIIATGYSRKPLQPVLKGLEDFKGEIIHSSQYRNGKSYKDKKVIVIGFGNSACEIAIDLHEHNAIPSLSVRKGVNVIPRDIAGISILDIVIAQSWLTKISLALADILNKPLLSIIYGDLEKYGLKKLPYGPITQVVKYKRIPLLDIGTVSLIKRGKIKVHPGIDHIKGDSLCFTDGKVEKYDTIIFATGYEPAVAEFLQGYDKVSDETGNPSVSGMESRLPNLYFCGFSLSPNGMLREIGIEAKRIAKALARPRPVLQKTI